MVGFGVIYARRLFTTHEEHDAPLPPTPSPDQRLAKMSQGVSNAKFGIICGYPKKKKLWDTYQLIWSVFDIRVIFRGTLVR